MSILGWIVLAFAAIAIGFFPLLAAITFVGSRFEKMRLSYSWHDLPESAMPSRPKELLQALDAGMRIVRMGQEHSSSVISMYGWLTLSEDGLIAGCFGKGRLGTTWMVMSRLTDGTFLETKAGIGTPLVPNRRILLEEVGTEHFNDMMLVHRSRLEQNVLPAEVLTAGSLPQVFTDADRAMYQDVIDAGYAVWLDAKRTVAKLTMLGSAKVAGRVLTIPFRISEFKRRVEELRPRWRGFPIEGETPAEYVVITFRSGGQDDYVYHADGQERRLTLFTDASRAREYHVLYPPAQGEERELQKVDASWVLECSNMGHQMVVDPHMAKDAPGTSG